MPFTTLPYAELIAKAKSASLDASVDRQGLLNEAVLRLRANRITVSQWRALASLVLGNEGISNLIPATLEYNSRGVLTFLIEQLAQAIGGPSRISNYAERHSKLFKSLVHDINALSTSNVVEKLGRLVVNHPLASASVRIIAAAFLNLPGLATPDEIRELKGRIQVVVSRKPESPVSMDMKVDVAGKTSAKRKRDHGDTGPTEPTEPRTRFQKRMCLVGNAVNASVTGGDIKVDSPRPCKI